MVELFAWVHTNIDTEMFMVALSISKSDNSVYSVWIEAWQANACEATNPGRGVKNQMPGSLPRPGSFLKV